MYLLIRRNATLSEYYFRCCIQNNNSINSNRWNCGFLITTSKMEDELFTCCTCLRTYSFGAADNCFFMYKERSILPLRHANLQQTDDPFGADVLRIGNS